MNMTLRDTSEGATEDAERPTAHTPSPRSKAKRPTEARTELRSDFLVFDLYQRAGTPKGEAAICDPRAEIEVGCQAVLVYSDDSGVLATVEHITPKQWVLRFDKEPPHKIWKEDRRLLRVVATLGIRRAFAL